MSRSRKLLTAATTLVLVMAFSSVADASGPSRTPVTTIRGVGSAYGSSRWTPNHATINHGGRVKWVASSYDHVLAAYGGNWTFRHALPQGSSVTRRFAHAGTFRFRCTVHSSVIDGRCQGMCGKVVVR